MRLMILMGPWRWLMVEVDEYSTFIFDFIEILLKLV